MSKVQPAKVATIDEVKSRIATSSTAVVTEYRGLTVAQISTLRRQLRTLGADYKVFKNTLVRRAIAGTDVESLAEFLVGPTAIAYSSDPVAVAKVLAEFAKANEKFVLLGGAFGETLLDAKKVIELSKMPSLDELRAKIVGMIQTPARRIATLLQAPGGQIARVIGAHSRKAA